MDYKSIGLTGVGNARQLGGYIGADGRKVKENLLLRTAQLADASTEDLKRLKEIYHLSDVVDFRTTLERDAKPDPEIEGVSNYHLPILDESSKESAGMAAAAAGGAFSLDKVMEFVEAGALENMYVDIAVSPYSQKQYTHFLQILVNHKEGAILWHCAGGKDRAGLGTVYVLAALGVDRETILADYMMTNHYYQEDIAKFEQYILSQGYPKETVKAARAMAGAEQAYLEKALAVIDEKYGSMDAYLECQLGLSVENKQKLRDRYLEI
ncbi:MAG: tyrosine-protein phosphatase [Faecalicatena sp.]|uniref:tyrosine-protein phosphatase n=1 Tax=Faecalicatena sp. TaxID=2005360 RepID=UPI002586AD71|nr:tyrosine-protein phosphatase [Faecalicatena sp.]MCI6467088.1 tyrosine-protein phosphatase [Faecalicatena sp.]MDY5618872.1 tyrosine-protein phosphatase [Lachnospiraceae bacterium]